jgi:hypothetical protein
MAVECEVAEPQQQVLAMCGGRLEAAPVKAVDPGQASLWVGGGDPDHLPGQLAADPPGGAGDRVSLGHPRDSDRSPLRRIT